MDLFVRGKQVSFERRTPRNTSFVKLGQPSKKEKKMVVNMENMKNGLLYEFEKELKSMPSVKERI